MKPCKHARTGGGCSRAEDGRGARILSVRRAEITGATLQWMSREGTIEREGEERAISQSHSSH